MKSNFCDTYDKNKTLVIELGISTVTIELMINLNKSNFEYFSTI